MLLGSKAFESPYGGVSPGQHHGYLTWNPRVKNIWGDAPAPWHKIGNSIVYADGRATWFTWASRLTGTVKYAEGKAGTFEDQQFLYLANVPP